MVEVISTASNKVAYRASALSPSPKRSATTRGIDQPAVPMRIRTAARRRARARSGRRGRPCRRHQGSRASALRRRPAAPRPLSSLALLPPLLRFSSPAPPPPLPPPPPPPRPPPPLNPGVQAAD